jgi:hypothetical protein
MGGPASAAGAFGATAVAVPGGGVVGVMAGCRITPVLVF